MEQVRDRARARRSPGARSVDANLRQRFGVVVVGIQRADGQMEFNPAPDTAMHAGDYLVVLGHLDKLRELESAAGQTAGTSVTRDRMTARLLDGPSVACGDLRERCCRTCSAFTARAGRPPGLGIVLVGEDPGVGDLRPQQGQGGHRVRPVGRSASGCRRRRRSTSCSALVERLNAQRSSTTASWCSRRCRRRWAATPRSGCSTRSIRPRTSTASIPVNVGRLVQGRAASGAVHAVGRDRDARSLRHRRSPARARSSSAAARSSASRWRCCCCSATPR